MKLTKLAIGLAAVLAFSAQANATNYTIDYSALSGDGYANAVFSGLNGSFSDTYTFTLPGTNDVSGSVIYNVLKQKTTVVSNVTDLTETLLNSSGTTLFSNAGVLTSADMVLAAGTYKVVIAGTGLGKSGGNYTFNAYAAPVPEPTEGALLMSGLGLMGFIAARRSRKV